MICKCFLPFCRLCFQFFDNVLFCKVLWWSPNYLFLLLLLMLLLLYLRIHCQIQGNPMLSSKSFMFLVLIFRLSINSKLIFVYGVKQWPKFILLHMVIQLSQHYVLKRLFLFHWMFFVPLLKISWLYVGFYFSILNFILLSILLPVLYYLVTVDLYW